MANKRISDLPEVTSPVTGDVFAIDGTTTRKITIDNLRSSLAALPGPDQVVTVSGPATVNNNAATVRVNQTAGAPITLTLPLASNKTCDVLIADWKGDAGTNNITISVTGTDRFQGGFSSWTIAGDTTALFFKRIPGVGYIVK